jgi:hypothetical protein
VTGTNGTDNARARDSNGGGPKPRRDWTRDWLASFEQTRSVSIACRAAHVGRTTAYRKRESNKRFRERWDEIEATMVDDLEVSTFARAVTGWGEPVFWQGRRITEFDPQTGKQRPVEIRRFDNTLSWRMLQARRPERYRFGLEAMDASETANVIRDTLRLMRGSVQGPPDASAQPESKAG